jgi:hypothetical protein
VFQKRAFVDRFAGADIRASKVEVGYVRSAVIGPAEMLRSIANVRFGPFTSFDTKGGNRTFAAGAK